MRKLLSLSILAVITSLVFSCAQRKMMFMNPNANIETTLEEIQKSDCDKSQVAQKFEEKIGNMELWGVLDYTKKYFGGEDYGYELVYEMTNGKFGTATVYLYKWDKRNVPDGLSQGALDDLNIECRTLEAKEEGDFTHSIETYSGIEFYKYNGTTALDAKNDKFEYFFYITGFEKIYLKAVFYYPYESDYGKEETEQFMEYMSQMLKKGKA